MTKKSTKPNFAQLHLAAAGELSKDAALPLYLRMWLLAVTRASPNGHAEFKRGELARILKGSARGSNVGVVIAQGVEYGLLQGDSMPTCLHLTNVVTPWDKPGENKAALPCKTHNGSPRPTFAADCHPNKPNHAHGFCVACYRRELRTAKLQERQPCWTVSEDVAGVADGGVSEDDWASIMAGEPDPVP